MDKTERMREDCRVLMAGQDGSTKAGRVSSSYYTLKNLNSSFEGWKFVASISSNLEQGDEKLVRYCSDEFRQIGRDSQLDVNQELRESVVRLRKRPELLTLVCFYIIN